MIKATIFLTAFLASSAMALSSSEQYGVIETITAWLGDIDSVNLFLERAADLSTRDLKNEAQIAWTRADNEPVQLNDLKDLPGLSEAGQNAANELAGVFAAVPANLTDIIVNAGNKRKVTEDLANLNDLRCTKVLPDIDILWGAAADLANWPAPPQVPRPTTCPSPGPGSSPNATSPGSCSGCCGFSATQTVTVSVTQSIH
jgi:hypothetical protein